MNWQQPYTMVKFNVGWMRVTLVCNNFLSLFGDVQLNSTSSFAQFMYEVADPK